MFGKNPIRSPERDPYLLAVQEVFYTIQGEGPYSGMPALFIRLAGCNLACHFCDTEFESQAENLRPAGEVFAEIESKFSPKQREFIVLTGGEPMRQNFMGLLGLLFASGTSLVQIETAGTLWVPGLEKYLKGDDADAPAVDIVCSPKTPRVDFNIVTFCRHWKYIIRAGELGEDGLPRRGTQLATKDKLSHIFRPYQTRLNPSDTQDTVWVSPCDDYDAEKNKANMQAAVESAMTHGYRLSLQVHKIVGVA